MEHCLLHSVSGYEPYFSGHLLPSCKTTSHSLKSEEVILWIKPNSDTDGYLITRQIQDELPVTNGAVKTLI
jgi:hypothetical protein